MMDNWKGVLGILGAGIAGAGLVVWFFFFQAAGPAPTQEGTESFGSSPVRTSTSVTPVGEDNGTLPVSGGLDRSRKIFKIADGPVAGAVLVDTTRPTSTIARYALAMNGHVFDLLLDSQGAVPKAVSNTTIPGIAEVHWSQGGRGALLRYVDDEVLKTAHLSMPAPSATSTSVRLQFLPAGISRLAVSPDGNSIAYLIKTAAGADGYIARADGGDTKKLFSLPLSQLELSWPAPNTILAQSASAARVGGVIFSINAQSGAVAPLLYAEGVTATANRDFSRIIYQTAGAERATYAQNTQTGLSVPLSFDPIPELCSWSILVPTFVYCASPVAYKSGSYLDLLHLGADSTPMSIIGYNLALNRSMIVAVPGSEGGDAAPIADIVVSGSNKYLLYITKGDRSLWGVRLTD